MVAGGTIEELVREVISLTVLSHSRCACCMDNGLRFTGVPHRSSGLFVVSSRILLEDMERIFFENKTRLDTDFEGRLMPGIER